MFIRIIKRRALENKHKEVIGLLEKSDNLDLENFLFQYGGELKESTSLFPLIWSGLKADEYTLSEVLAISKGSSFSSLHMEYNVLKHQNLMLEINTYSVPLYFFIGQSDYTTSIDLVIEYHNKIDAPSKELVVFKNSSHFPFFEEPLEFSKN